MAPTATIEDRQRNSEPDSPAAPSSRRAAGTMLGTVLLVLGVTGFGAWFGWRISHPEWNLVALAFFVAEVTGVVGAVVVGSGLARAGAARDVFAAEPRDSYWYAHATADLVGRTRAADLHRDVRTAVRASPRWRWRDGADATIAAILLDGPRRLLMIVAVVVGLLLGATPFGRPPGWAVAALTIGMLGVAGSHVALGQGRLRFGDRVRWSYGAIGEIVVRDDVANVAPRRWTGAMAAAVAVSVAIGLRGMSDRWTHGLPAMSDDDRVTVLVVALTLVLGALFTVATSPRPTQVDAHLLSRRMDERTARQSVLVAAVCIGAIGLVAGLLPSGGSDGADHRRPPTTAAISAEAPRG
jgi:hypothetical protein